MAENTQPSKKKLPTTNPSNKRFQDYGKYAGIALQMGITIALGTWGGMKLDEWLSFKKIPVFTLTLSLLSVIGSMYLVLKDLLKK